MGDPKMILVPRLRPTVGKRKQVRLRDFDYSQHAAYFVTICCYEMKSLWGRVEQSEVSLNKLRKIAVDSWLQIPRHFAYVTLDEYIAMPNHLHGVLIFSPEKPFGDETQKGRPWATPTDGGDMPLKRAPLSTVVNQYKQAVTRAIRKELGNSALRVFQRGYYEHVVRDEDDLNSIRQYIIDNPRRWELKRIGEAG